MNLNILLRNFLFFLKKQRVFLSSIIIMQLKDGNGHEFVHAYIRALQTSPGAILEPNPKVVPHSSKH